MREKKKISAKEQGFYIYCCETGSLTKLNLSKGMTFTLQCEVYMYSKTSQRLHNFFQEMHIV